MWDRSPSKDLPSPRTWVWYVGPSLLFLAAVATRLGTLYHAPTFDELYHLLAARSWAEEGTLRIADGVYSRYALFTVMIGALFRALGQSLAVARLPTLLAGSLLVSAVFIWTRSVAGRGAAWIAAGLLCLSPLAIFLSGFIRPYSIHALLFFLGSVSLYAAVHNQGSLLRSVGLTISSAALLGSAYYFQSATLIGLCGLGAWLIVDRFRRSMRSGGHHRRLPWILALAAGGLVAIYLIAEFTTLGRSLLQSYASVSEWSSGRDLRFYHWVLLGKYPTLWTLLPLAALLAIARRTAPSLFCSTILVVGLILHSLAGMKAERYLLYLMPYFFMLWGIALREAGPLLRQIVRRGARTILAVKDPRRGWVVSSTWLAAGLTLLFLLASNPAFPMAFRLIRGEAAYSELRQPFRISAMADWQSALPLLGPWIRDADVLVTTNGLKTLYEFGRYDIEFSATHLSDFPGASEFTIDPRTGRPIISSPQSLQRIFSCYSEGLFLSPPEPLQQADDDVIRVMEENTRPLHLPVRSGLEAFVWQRKSTRPPALECAGLRSRSGPDQERGE